MAISHIRLPGEGVLWKTRNFYILNQKPLARSIRRAYIPPSRRPQLVYRGPRQWAREKLLSSVFWTFFGLLKVAEKRSEIDVDGKEDWVLYPALSQTGPARLARTDAADSRTKVHCPQDV